MISEAASDVHSVRRLVYVTAFLTEAGEDSTAILSDYGSPITSAVVFTDTGVTVDPNAARELFYGDSDDETVAESIARLRPMPRELAVQKLKPGWKSIPSTHVVCTNDRVLPLEAQRWMASRADEVVQVASDHSPFINHSTAIADVLVTLFP